MKDDIIQRIPEAHSEKKYLQVYGIRPKNQLSDFKREVVDSLVFSRSETCIAISALIGVSLQEKKSYRTCCIYHFPQLTTKREANARNVSLESPYGGQFSFW